MTKRIFISALSFILSTPVFGADAQKPHDPKMQEMMKKYQEYGTPGPSHKVLSDLAGDWKVAAKLWESADAQPQSSGGTASFKMILGGRWLQQEFKGEMMGQAYEGLGLMGYDNVQKKYVTLWLDSMATGMMIGSGSFDSTSKTLKDKSVASCPISASKKVEMRGEWQIADKNKMVYTMYGSGPMGGKEFKNMEITYTRK